MTDTIDLIQGTFGLQKTCRGCGELKRSESFYADQYSPDGLRPRCKICMKQNPDTKGSRPDREQPFPQRFWKKVDKNGPIPCRNRACVRPSHLEPVTGKVNSLRGLGAGALNARKTHCVNGHPFDSGNTIMRPKRRLCRECKRLSSQRSRDNLKVTGAHPS